MVVLERYSRKIKMVPPSYIIMIWDHTDMKSFNSIITQIAETRGRVPSRLFGINQSDRLFHQYIIGQTGTGKSSLLLQLMKQDLDVEQGFCLIDPHGDLAKSIISNHKQGSVILGRC